MKLFTSLDANVGFDVKQIIQRNQAVTDEQKMQVNPGKFLGGFSASVNTQPFSRWAFGTGLRYAYVEPNLHTLHGLATTYFFLNDTKDEDFTFVSAKAGFQINHSIISNSNFFGLGIGKFWTIDNYFGQKMEIGLERFSLDKQSNFFFVFSYGIFISSNKNL